MPPYRTSAERFATPLPTSWLWRWVAALAVFGNIFLTYYANTHPFQGQTMGEVSAKYPTLLTPEGYAFSIWGLIFLSLAVYAVWQLLPTSYKSSLPDAVARPLALANAATAAWVVLFAYERILPSVGVMLLILVALITVYGRARRRVLAETAPAWTSVPFALYLAWISVATVLNVTIGLQKLGVRADVDGAVLWALVLLAVVVVLALVIGRQFQEVVFPAVVAWALVGIWVERMRDLPTLGWAALAGAGVALIGGGVLARTGVRKQPWQLRDEAAKAIEAEIAASAAKQSNS